MTVNDLGKAGRKQRYDTKNPNDRGHVGANKPLEPQPSTSTPDVEPERKQPGYRGEDSTQTNRRAAQQALGFGDAPKTTAPKGAGAKSAVHGMGMLERAMHKLRKGTLVALAGLSILSAGEQARHTMPTGNPFNRAVHTSLIDLRTQGGGKGQRAMADAQQLVNGWITEIGRDGTFGVDAKRARDLVAAALLPGVAPPGADLAAFAKDKLGDDTKALINGLLDGAQFKLSPDARAFFEGAVGRSHTVSSDGKIEIVGDQKDGMISVKGPPGASIEVINLSTIPTKRLHTDDTFVLGTVKADGTFSGKMDMQGGDVIRLRMKLPDGTTTASIDFQATGMASDARNAEAALFRVGLVDNKDGTLSVNNINASRPVSEPGAVMRFVNSRTGQATDVAFDKDGTFAKDQKIPGKTGDTFSIRVTDNVNDTALAKEIGTLTVRDAGRPSFIGFDLKDPSLHHDEKTADGKDKFGIERFHGALFDSTGAEYTDVTQGQLGDCYFPASASTIAFHVKGHFEKIMKEVRETDPNTGDEKVWYEVTFKEKDWSNGGKYKDVVVKVDGDLYVRSWGGPLYGADDGARSPENMELWFSVLEKAYAMWKGESYEAIGNGGSMNTVFQDILGVDATSTWIGEGRADATWKQIKESVDKHRPIGAGTHGDDQEALYANTGVYADHAYSIIGYKTDDKGVKYVQLRNPWGESEPFPGDGKNDGIFYLKLDDFMKLYQTLYYTTGDVPGARP